MPPQTDGRALWEPRGEIYLQIIQQKWREEEREWRQRGGREECGEREREREQIKVAKRARRRGAQREKQGLSRVVVQSAKRVRDKHTESTQSQSTKTNESDNLGAH